MKQYTNAEQTTKLIELGFEKPKSVVNHYGFWVGNCVYSIGELIEMLPEKICIDETLYSRVIDKNDVYYYSWELNTYALLICDVKEELVDNLFDMIVQFKEEGVICGKQ